MLLRLATGIYDEGYWMKPPQKALHQAQGSQDLVFEYGLGVVASLLCIFGFEDLEQLTTKICS